MILFALGLTAALTSAALLFGRTDTTAAAQGSQLAARQASAESVCSPNTCECIKTCKVFTQVRESTLVANPPPPLGPAHLPITVSGALATRRRPKPCYAGLVVTVEVTYQTGFATSYVASGTAVSDRSGRFAGVVDFNGPGNLTTNYRIHASTARTKRRFKGERIICFAARGGNQVIIS